MTLRSLIPGFALVAACGQAGAPPPITAPFSDDFERAAPGNDWLATDADAYKISGGMLNARGAYNHPLWLRRKLPAECDIEFDVKSLSPEGDIKFEAWGDGRHHAPSKAKVQYTASGYVFVFGGWGNTASLIAKRSEHGKDLVSRSDFRVEPGRLYHMKLTRSGGRIDWFVDDLSKPFLSYTDPEPLTGDGAAYFAFSNWETDVWFDNLKVVPK
jgi:hypothetical protein